MSRLVVILTGSVAVVAAVAPASASARGLSGRLRRCAPNGAVVLLSNPHDEVFRYRSGIYTCRRRNGAIGYLGHAEETPRANCVDGEERCGEVSDEALAGTVVAYAESRVEPTGRQPQRIIVRSIPSGRVLHEGSLYVATPQRTFLEEARPLRIVVNDEGTVAWVQEDWYARHGGGMSPPTVYDLFVVDSEGFQSLRTELRAEPRSLRFVGDKLFWIQEGSPQSAMLE
jgi:hypothetical protein